MAALDDAAPIPVEVAYSPRAGVVDTVPLRLPAGATVLDALRASGFLARYLGIDLATLAVGVWGRRCVLGTPLRPHDRVEIYRPLALDPKDARRVRDRQQRRPANTKPVLHD